MMHQPEPSFKNPYMITQRLIFKKLITSPCNRLTRVSINTCEKQRDCFYRPLIYEVNEFRLHTHSPGGIMCSCKGGESVSLNSVTFEWPFAVPYFQEWEYGCVCLCAVKLTFLNIWLDYSWKSRFFHLHVHWAVVGFLTWGFTKALVRDKDFRQGK